jgi:hypothetical protein
MRKMFAVLFALVLLLPCALQAQPALNGTIGLDALPDDKASICTAPMFNITYPWDLNSYPQFPITVIPDFTLYTKDSVGYTASKVLASGKPMVLIDGSYTCDVFRYAIPQINQIKLRYGDSISIFVIYTLEAHPIVDPNFYRNGQNWVVKNDSTDNVLYRQPKTYGERRAMVDTMLKRQTSPSIEPTILLDGPCNEWWRAFGPAPNNAYLIAADGRVVKHQAWFNVNWIAGQQTPKPDFLSYYIDTLLHPELRADVRSQATLATSVWPNPVPTGSTLHISVDAPLHITLFDLLGRAVLSKDVSEGVSIEGLTTGTYFYRLDGASSKTGRLIITP